MFGLIFKSELLVVRTAWQSSNILCENKSGGAKTVPVVLYSHTRAHFCLSQALAEALKINIFASISNINLANNRIGLEGAKAWLVVARIQGPGSSGLARNPVFVLPCTVCGFCDVFFSSNKLLYDVLLCFI